MMKVRTKRRVLEKYIQGCSFSWFNGLLSNEHFRQGESRIGRRGFLVSNLFFTCLVLVPWTQKSYKDPRHYQQWRNQTGLDCSDKSHWHSQFEVVLMEL